jgi:metal-dependent amidase/aminoacylase/carboxypeptidase family protein
VMAAATVMRLQTIVSREIAPSESAVVTIGSLHAGTTENVIPDEAILTLNIRTFDERVRKRVLSSIERIIKAEASASGAPKVPEITASMSYSAVINDTEATKRVVDSFRLHFPKGCILETRSISASEDFGTFGTESQTPSVYWIVGGTDLGLYAKAKRTSRMDEIPTNHSPHFAPVIHPTLKTGVEAFVYSAGAWLFT